MKIMNNSFPNSHLSFDRTNSDVIIAGDFNVNLLKINEKEVFAEFFYTLTSK